MKRHDAKAIVVLLNDIITNRRGASLFPNGEEGPPSNLGVIWISEVAKIPEQEAALAMDAAVALMTGTTRVPTPVDFREMFQKVKRDKRMNTRKLEEGEFVRELEAWVKGWLVARAERDLRVWPEQKDGYTALQADNPYQRTYVWLEQEEMPEPERLEYEKIGADLSAAQAAKLLGLMTGEAMEGVGS